MEIKRATITTQIGGEQMNAQESDLDVRGLCSAGVSVTAGMEAFDVFRTSWFFGRISLPAANRDSWLDGLQSSQGFGVPRISL